MQQKSELRAQRRHYLCRKLLNALSGYWRSICDLCWSGLWKHTFLCVGLSGTNLLVFADDISLSVKYHPPAAFGTPNSVVVVVVSPLQLACRACVLWKLWSLIQAWMWQRKTAGNGGKREGNLWQLSSFVLFFFYCGSNYTRLRAKGVISLSDLEDSRGSTYSRKRVSLLQQPGRHLRAEKGTAASK